MVRGTCITGDRFGGEGVGCIEFKLVLLRLAAFGGLIENLARNLVK